MNATCPQSATGRNDQSRRQFAVAGLLRLVTACSIIFGLLSLVITNDVVEFVLWYVGAAITLMLVAVLAWLPLLTAGLLVAVLWRWVARGFEVRLAAPGDSRVAGRSANRRFRSEGDGENSGLGVPQRDCIPAP